MKSFFIKNKKYFFWWLIVVIFLIWLNGYFDNTSVYDNWIISFEYSNKWIVSEWLNKYQTVIAFSGWCTGYLTNTENENMDKDLSLVMFRQFFEWGKNIYYLSSLEEMAQKGIAEAVFHWFPFWKDWIIMNSGDENLYTYVWSKPTKNGSFDIEIRCNINNDEYLKLIDKYSNLNYSMMNYASLAPFIEYSIILSSSDKSLGKTTTSKYNITNIWNDKKYENNLFSIVYSPIYKLQNESSRPPTLVAFKWEYARFVVKITEQECNDVLWNCIDLKDASKEELQIWLNKSVPLVENSLKALALDISYDTKKIFEKDIVYWNNNQPWSVIWIQVSNTSSNQSMLFIEALTFMNKKEIHLNIVSWSDFTKDDYINLIKSFVLK